MIPSAPCLQRLDVLLQPQHWFCAMPYVDTCSVVDTIVTATTTMMTRRDDDDEYMDDR